MICQLKSHVLSCMFKVALIVDVFYRKIFRFNFRLTLLLSIIFYQVRQSLLKVT